MSLFIKIFSLTLAAVLGANAWHFGAPLLEADKTADHWVTQCDAPTPCFAQMDSAGARVLLGWNEAEKAVRVGVLVPPAVGSNTAVTLWLDDGGSIFLATGVCTQSYCEAMAPPDKTDAIVERLRRVEGGVIAYPEAGKLRVTELLLGGFETAARSVLARGAS